MSTALSYYADREGDIEDAPHTPTAAELAEGYDLYPEEEDGEEEDHIVEEFTYASHIQKPIIERTAEDMALGAVIERPTSYGLLSRLRTGKAPANNRWAEAQVARQIRKPIKLGGAGKLTFKKSIRPTTAVSKPSTKAIITTPPSPIWDFGNTLVSPSTTSSAPFPKSATLPTLTQARYTPPRPGPPPSPRCEQLLPSTSYTPSFSTMPKAPKRPKGPQSRDLPPTLTGATQAYTPYFREAVGPNVPPTPGMGMGPGRWSGVVLQERMQNLRGGGGGKGKLVERAARRKAVDLG